MSQKYTIRDGSLQDLPALATINDSMGEQHFAFDPEVWNRDVVHPERMQGEFENLVMDSDSIFLVAEDATGRAAGYLSGSAGNTTYERTSSRTGKISEIVIDPAHRGQGLGTLLMEAAMAKLKQLGAEDVTLHVAVKNEGGVRFYERLGFRPIMVRMFKTL